MTEDNNPYAVERTVFQYGRPNVAAELPDDLILTLIRLPSTDYFQLIVNQDDAGAYHRSDDFVTKAAQFLAKGESANG